MKNRCPWPKDDALMIEYHDKEWGVPVHDDTKLFEFMLLDAFQAGLSWKTILHRREGFSKAFDNFDYQKIAKYTKSKYNKLLSNESIIRNSMKIRVTIDNAKAYIIVQKEFGSFDKYIWQFVKYRPVINKWKDISKIPPASPESEMMSKDLKKRGFKFVGTTICYAFMQAAGMVNDHLVSCPRYKEVCK